MARAHTQPDERRSINPRDQFGRLWAMSIEIRTGEPTGAILPAGWSDPLRTPMQFVKMAMSEFGQADLGRVNVDYTAWLAQIETDEERWYRQLHQNALQMYKSVDPDQVSRLDQDKFLLDLTGPKPFPSSTVLKQARDGDRAYLGFEPLTREHRAALRMPTLEDLQTTGIQGSKRTMAPPPETYQEFVKWCYDTKQANDLATIGQLWKEHRTNLAAV